MKEIFNCNICGKELREDEKYVLSFMDNMKTYDTITINGFFGEFIVCNDCEQKLIIERKQNES